MTSALEQEPRRNSASREALKYVSGKVKETAVKTGAYLYIPGMIERTTRELFLESGFENIALLKEPLAQGKQLVIVMSHQSLGDVGPALRVSSAIRKEHGEYVDSFSYVLSKTINNGKQGDTTRNLSVARDRLFGRNKTKALEVASTRDAAERDTAQEFGDTRAVLEAIKKPGVGVKVHIEANMNAGRVEPGKTQTNGMGPMDTNVRKILGHVLGYKPDRESKSSKSEQVVFLPVGIDGSYKMYSPDTRKITPKGWSMIWQLEGSRILTPLADLAPSIIGTIRVGKPFTNEDLALFDNPLREIELRVAKELPPDARGVFKDALRGSR